MILATAPINQLHAASTSSIGQLQTVKVTSNAEEETLGGRAKLNHIDQPKRQPLLLLSLLAK